MNVVQIHHDGNNVDEKPRIMEHLHTEGYEKIITNKTVSFLMKVVQIHHDVNNVDEKPRIMEHLHTEGYEKTITNKTVSVIQYYVPHARPQMYSASLSQSFPVQD